MTYKVVNITLNSSAEGLRDELEREARSRGKPLRSFVGAIYVYAVENQHRFRGSLKGAKKKPGDHIGATVPEETAKLLEDWAKKEATSRGMWCCYVLERVLQDNLLDRIFGAAQES